MDGAVQQEHDAEGEDLAVTVPLRRFEAAEQAAPEQANDQCDDGADREADEEPAQGNDRDEPPPAASIAIPAPRMPRTSARADSSTTTVLRSERSPSLPAIGSTTALEATPSSEPSANEEGHGSPRMARAKSVSVPAVSRNESAASPDARRRPRADSSRSRPRPPSKRITTSASAPKYGAAFSKSVPGAIRSSGPSTTPDEMRRTTAGMRVFSKRTSAKYESTRSPPSRETKKADSMRETSLHAAFPPAAGRLFRLMSNELRPTMAAGRAHRRKGGST